MNTFYRWHDFRRKEKKNQMCMRRLSFFHVLCHFCSTTVFFLNSKFEQEKLSMTLTFQYNYRKLLYLFIWYHKTAKTQLHIVENALDYYDQLLFRWCDAYTLT